MPKIVDRVRTRTGILDAALSVYGEKGYHAATIADVAAAAGVGKGTLYLYFENKEGIAAALVDRHFARLEDKFAVAPAPGHLDDFLDGLRAAMMLDEDDRTIVRVFFDVFGPSLAADAFVTRAAGFFDRLGGHYADQVAGLQRSCAVAPHHDPAALGRALASLVDGIVLHQGLFALPPKRQDAMVGAALSLFVDGLRR